MQSALVQSTADGRADVGRERDGPDEGATGALHGLTAAEAAERLQRYGPNELPHGRRGGVLALVIDVASEPMILLLLACGAIYFLLGDAREGSMLLASVVVVIGISFYQTRRTERAVAALRDLSSPRALVMRDGQAQRIAGRDVVPGDVAVLAEGDRVPADGVVLSTVHLEVDESLLTGESVPVRKVSAEGDPGPPRPGGDDTPFVFSGTLVVAGQAITRITATGAETELGRIGRSLAGTVVTDTPLQQQVATAVKVLGGIGLVLCVLVATLYAVLRASWLEGALAGLALAMSLMPEEFPVILTLFLALGAWRIARHNVLVRRMAALEALGSATVLCVDKTGTLTENRMRIVRLCADGAQWAPSAREGDQLPEAFHRLLEFAVLASAENLLDPMEQAINSLGREALAGTEHLHRVWTLAREYPLSRELLAMSHVWRAVEGEAWIVAAKGAPEAIVDLCHLGDERRRAIDEQVGALAADGLRVLGVAAAMVRAPALPLQQHDFPFELVGLLGFIDPIRPTVPDAVTMCRRAGIRTVMITGDYPATARAIAAAIGLGAAPQVLTGGDLDGMDDAALAARVSEVDVFARVVPEQKLRLVQAFRAAGQVVVMTGDGVNDAPALRAADIGIAMGARGTDVAREAADLVLVDDDFLSIVRAVRLGRRIYENIRKGMRYVVSIHVPIGGIALVPILLGWPLVLLPLHIVFLELIIDPACSIAFEAEPEEPGLMDRPPRPSGEPILDGRTLLIALLQGGLALLVVCGLLAAVTLAGYAEAAARTVTFSALILMNLGLILTSRTSTRVGRVSWRGANPSLWAVIGGAVALLAAVLWIAPLRSVFRLAPPSALDIALAVAAGAVAFAGFEAVKALVGHRAAIR